jgi:hypothetical protein
MRHTFPRLALMILFAMPLPMVVADDNADATTQPDAQIKKIYDKLIKSGKSFLGRLVKIDADKHYLIVEVAYKSPKQDGQTVQRLANLQAQMVDAQRQRNPVERLKQLNRIQLEIEKAKGNLYKDVSQKIDLDAPQDMKVRTMLLPVEFDEKGKPRKLTEKEKRELKGPDPSLPGYTADLETLKPDQLVEIYLAKQGSKSKAKDNDPDPAESSRPKTAMIVIRAEAQK